LTSPLRVHAPRFSIASAFYTVWTQSGLPTVGAWAYVHDPKALAEICGSAMKIVALVVGFSVVIGIGATRGGEPDATRMPDEALVNALIAVDTPTVGLSDTQWFTAFIADQDPPRFEEGLLGVPLPPPASPEMRELVRRGAEALPTLIRHLSDARPTGLVVGVRQVTAIVSDPGHPSQEVSVNFYRWMQYAEEYTPRSGRDPFERAPILKPPPEGYRVKVGDICFVLVGQIVNRRLDAVRYQASAGYVVNSPVVTPQLASRVRRDWAGANARDLETSLLGDIRGDDVDESFGAFERLRLYYPAAYNALSGSDRARRDAFEETERKQKG
jgi:hypothetical protein